MIEWIDIEIRLPQNMPDDTDNKNYLTFNGEIGIDLWFLDDYDTWKSYGITHWAELPKSPDEIAKLKKDRYMETYDKMMKLYDQGLITMPPKPWVDPFDTKGEK